MMYVNYSLIDILIQPVEADLAKPVLPAQSPIVRRPSPLAIKIIERFLHKKKLRLIDLFKTVDKRKSWMISKDDFRKAIIKVCVMFQMCILYNIVMIVLYRIKFNLLVLI